MAEAHEAGKFNKELDKLLSGERAEKESEGEVSKDLEVAYRLLSSDLSPESRVRASLKAELLGQGKKSRIRSFFPFPAWSVLATCSAVAALLLMLPQSDKPVTQGQTEPALPSEALSKSEVWEKLAGALRQAGIDLQGYELVAIDRELTQSELIMITKLVAQGRIEIRLSGPPLSDFNPEKPKAGKARGKP